MEWTWGTYFTVLITGYLLYYGVVFIFDLLTKGRTTKVEAEGVEYSMGDLVDEEEETPQVLTKKSFAEPTVKTHNTPAPAAADDTQEEEYKGDTEQRESDTEQEEGDTEQEEDDADQEEAELPQAAAESDAGQYEAELPHAAAEGDTDRDELAPLQASSPAGDTDQDEPELPQAAAEDSVKMAIVGEPMQPTNYLKMIREQAQKSALSQSRVIFG